MYVCMEARNHMYKYTFTQSCFIYSYIYTVTVQVLRHAVKEELNKFLAAEPVSSATCMCTLVIVRMMYALFAAI